MDARDQNIGDVKRRAARRLKGLRRLIRSRVNFNLTTVANEALRHLDLALKPDDTARKLRSEYYAYFLERRHISDPASDQAAQFVADRDSLDRVLADGSNEELRKILQIGFFMFVDHIWHDVESVLRLTRLMSVTKPLDGPFRDEKENNEFLDRILRHHYHDCLTSYEFSRFTYVYSVRNNFFRLPISSKNMLGSVLEIAHRGGLCWNGISKMIDRDAVLRYMWQESYDLVETLIDYGYGFTGEDVKDFEVFSKVFGDFIEVFTIQFCDEIQSSSVNPVTFKMIMYAITHCMKPRKEGFVPAYEKLHKSLGLPPFSSDFIRTYLEKVLREGQVVLFRSPGNPVLHPQQSALIEEMCRAYEKSVFEKSSGHTPRTLVDLSVCAVRRTIREINLLLLPSAIDELQVSERVKDLLRLKT